MASALEQVTALPTTGQLSRAGLRDMLTRRTALCLSASESLANFLVVDATTGVIPQFVIQNGTIYEYDPLDTTTVASATCLVSGDATGRRYKTGGITAPWSVLSATTSAQPVSPSVGDRYLVPTAATGSSWSGKDGQVAIYSRAGWQFATVPIGRGLYAEDTNIRYYRNSSGVWTSGFGAVQIGANALNITNMLGANASYVVRVENQTTNTAPGSPTAFTAYIVGPSPAGAWSAYSPGDVALCLTNGTWTRRVPVTGDQVYDKSLGYRVEWNGTAWISGAGAYVAVTAPGVIITPSTAGGVGTGDYVYDPTAAPGNNAANTTITTATKHKARRIGAKLEIFTSVDFTGSPDADYVCAIARNSELATLDFKRVRSNSSGLAVFSHTFEVTANSTSLDSYYLSIFRIAGVLLPSSLVRYTCIIRERA